MEDSTTSVDSTPETNIALGVSSSLPCVNGQAKEDTSDSASLENEGCPVGNTNTSTTADLDCETSSSLEKMTLLCSNEENGSFSSSKSTAGTKRGSKANRASTSNNTKAYPFMGYQILPIIPQPVLLPVMSKNFMPQQETDPLSTTNLYIKGLAENCSDEDLVDMCKQYGKIVSTKAILDKKTGICKGYGFVDFQDTADAHKAVQSLRNNGILAQFAKLQEQDPTNLYMSNLPKNYTEKHLEQMLGQYGTIISTRILRDPGGVSRGVGFVRLDSHEHCQLAIEKLSGTTFPGLSEPLNIKLADGSTNKKKIQGPWKDVDLLGWKEYSGQEQQQYIYDVPPVIAPPNGYVGSRIMSPNVVSASPYLHQSSQIAGYHPVQGSTNSSSWQNHYYLPPGTSEANVHGGNNSTSGTSAAAPPPSYHPTHHDQQYSMPPPLPSATGSANGGGHTPSPMPPTAQYTQQPPGWTIRLSHTPHFIQQHT